MVIPSSFRARRSAVLTLQLTPLIDCVFLLLIYFLCSSSFPAGERSLSGRLNPLAGGAGAPPKNAPSSESDFDPIVVRVFRRDSQIAWTIQDATIPSVADLQRSLESIARIKPDVPVTISPSSDIPLGDVISAYDLARLAGLTKIQFAASMSPAAVGPVER